jgi:hypothetical protein
MVGLIAESCSFQTPAGASVYDSYLYFEVK